MKPQKPIVYANNGTAAVWVREGVYQVGWVGTGLTIERKARRWYVIVNGRRLSGPFQTLRQSLDIASVSYSDPSAQQ